MTSILFELCQELLCLEVFWNGLVVTSDYFVNLLFPRGLDVLAGLERVEELAQGGLDYRNKMVGNLKQNQRVTS